MTMRSMLQWSLERYADAEAAADGRSVRTYRELDLRTNQVARALQRLGVARGDRVGVLMDNQVEYLETEIGIAKLGAVRVPMLLKASRSEIGTYLEQSQCAVVFAGGEGLMSLRATGAPVRVVRVTHPAGADGADGQGAGLAPGELDYEVLLAEVGTDPVDVDVVDDDDYAVRFTGGTSGRPKGIQMSQRTMANVVNNLLLSLPVGLDETVCHVHPVSHASGKIMYTWFMRGARQVFLPTFSFDPKRLLRTIAQERVTTMFLVPSAINTVLDCGLLGEFDTSSLRRVIYGGSPIPSRRVLQALAAFGPVLVQIYGSSEAPNALTVLSEQDHVFTGPPPRRLRSAGRVAYNVEVRVVDDQGHPCPPDQLGEIISRGPHTMRGYWRDPDLTAERVIDGWVHTGDMGMFDENGYLYIVDRKDDVIISGGFNIWPAEVEDALCRTDDVIDAAVVGLPDDRWGEAVHAAVVTKPGSTVSEDELRRRLREVLPGYKVPKRIVLSTVPLPKSAAGKTLRRAVREELRGPARD